MITTRALLLGALLAAVAAAPARADLRLWTMCTPGALRSCHSVSITTTAVYTGSVRTGTAVSLSVSNLQGSGLPNVGTAASGLYRLVFTSALAVPLPATIAFPAAVMTGGGASGAITWQAVATTISAPTPYAWFELTGNQGGTKLIGGCAIAPMIAGTITAQTCGTTAKAVFTFSIAGALDASQLTNVFVHAYGSQGSESCYTNPASVPFKGPACDNLVDPLAVPVTPVPEPGTLLLLGTGLAAGWRAGRRRWSLVAGR